MDEEDYTVQFVHQTVRQFLLEDPVDPDLTEFHFGMEDADHTIGEICVTYLNFSDFKRTLAHTRTPVLLPSPSRVAEKAYGRHSVQALILRMISNSASTSEGVDIEPMIHAIAGLSSKAATPTQRHPFLDYASANWFAHTKSFEETKSRTWKLWKHMIIDEHEMMPGPSELAGFFLHNSNGTKLMERICRTSHYGILRLISSAGSRVRLEFIQKTIGLDNLSLMKLIMDLEKFREAAHEVLSKAAKFGNLKAVELLIAAGTGTGSDLLGLNDARKTALYLAAKAGHLQIVNNLLTLATEEDNASLWIAYHELTIHPDWPPGRLLQKAGANILKRSHLPENTTNTDPSDGWEHIPNNEGKDEPL
ncbi:hypothetical protein ONZ43_g3704 [Nemania bipapillata]|uniref:Uncharacterized protein n=1 Tax=Nemania bipapillata TaxID=110536 RepID=A0ACC2IW89_9PEZI|nr:hypothetical protein ONZ43_g3704 [Nemania bipapillata]